MRRHRKKLVGIGLAALAVALSQCSPQVHAAGRPSGTFRVATYNVEWFSEEANPARVANLRSVLGHVDPDVVAFEEVQSEKALRQILDSDWDVGMEDDPSDQQETAIAVRRPFVLVSAQPVFSGPAFEKSFPHDRDGLRCVVQSPEGVQLVFYVVHLKSRRGGRLETDPEREAACGLLAAYVHSHQDEKEVIVLGDFNDAPDDASAEALETGNLLVEGGPIPDTRKFLVNLTRKLADLDYVTIGMHDLFQGRDLRPIVPGAKADNDRLRGLDYSYPRDVKVKQGFFDQILVSDPLSEHAQVYVYGGADALRGQPGRTRVSGNSVEYTFKGDLASDHLPVYADLPRPERAGP